MRVALASSCHGRVGRRGREPGGLGCRRCVRTRMRATSTGGGASGSKGTLLEFFPPVFQSKIMLELFSVWLGSIRKHSVFCVMGTHAMTL
jgi:hypothetical protein